MSITGQRPPAASLAKTRDHHGSLHVRIGRRDAGAGGIVGYNYGPLSNVYSTSAVSAPTIFAGGSPG